MTLGTVVPVGLFLLLLGVFQAGLTAMDGVMPQAASGDDLYRSAYFVLVGTNRSFHFARALPNAQSAPALWI